MRELERLWVRERFEVKFALITIIIIITIIATIIIIIIILFFWREFLQFFNSSPILAFSLVLHNKWNLLLCYGYLRFDFLMSSLFDKHITYDLCIHFIKSCRTLARTLLKHPRCQCGEFPKLFRDFSRADGECYVSQDALAQKAVRSSEMISKFTNPHICGLRLQLLLIILDNSLVICLWTWMLWW